VKFHVQTIILWIAVYIPMPIKCYTNRRTDADETSHSCSIQPEDVHEG